MSPSFAQIVRDDFHYAPTVAFVSLSNKEPNSNAVPKFYVDAITHFPDPLAPGFTATATIGESDEAANYGTRCWVGFCVSNVCRRTCRPSTRDGLLAWRGFRRERSLERHTAERGTLCCRSKENSVWQQSCLS